MKKRCIIVCKFVLCSCTLNETDKTWDYCECTEFVNKYIILITLRVLTVDINKTN
jgi:hypothetical protein